MRPDDALIPWLLEGDPAIRWQVMRDLQGRPYEAERARVARSGWGKRLLDCQAPNGRWSTGRGPETYRGLYIPKWTSTTYTMLLLRHLGLPAHDPHARAGCRELACGAEWFPSGGLGYFVSRRIAEPCVSAMVLSILEAFDYDREPRDRLTKYLLADQHDDGGWNCEIGDRHSSFNSTCSALEALELRSPPPRQVIARGLEFFLQHQLFCSHRTGKPAMAHFMRLAPLVGWQYNLLRGLELFARADADYDPRLEKAIAIVLRRRRKDGRWDGVAPPAGALHFRLEPRGPSRWTTLRCLRVLRWWDATKSRASRN